MYPAMKTAASVSSVEELKAQLAASRNLSGSRSPSLASSSSVLGASSTIPNPFQATPQAVQNSIHKMPFGTARPSTIEALPNMANIHASINSPPSTSIVNKSASLTSTAQIVNGFLQLDKFKVDLGEVLQGKKWAFERSIITKTTLFSYRSILARIHLR